MGRKNIKSSRGLTLIEILIVIMVVGLLALLVALSINPSIQIGKSRDARRKSDLKKIATSLEDYAGDHNCYPTAIYSSGCTVSAEFDPYIKRMPCDPETKQPYPYERPDNCKQFVIYATLENELNANYGQGNYIVTSPNYNLEPVVGTSGFYGCFGGVCVPLAESGECTNNFINFAPCSGNECCTFGGDDRCVDEGGQPTNECIRP